MNLQLSFKVGDLSNSIYLRYLPTLFQDARLFQQYLVDAFATVDQTKLEWICMNQSQIRSDLYNGLADAMVRDEVNPQALGR